MAIVKVIVSRPNGEVLEELFVQTRVKHETESLGEIKLAQSISELISNNFECEDNVEDFEP